MREVSAARLNEVLSGAADKLDLALSQGLMRDYLLGKRGLYEGSIVSTDTPPNLFRRSPICQFTNQLLGIYLESHDIPTIMYLKNGGEHPITLRGKQYPATHILSKVAIDDGYRFVDPTTEQFYGLSGLTRELAEEHPEVVGLYPDGYVSRVHSVDDDFGEEFAINAHAIEQQLLGAGYEIGKTRKELLVGTTLDEKISVYGQIWDMSTYDAYRHSSGPELRAALSHAAGIIDDCKTTWH